MAGTLKIVTDASFEEDVLGRSVLEDGALARCQGAQDALQVLKGGEVDDDLALLLAQIHAHPRLETVREPNGQLAEGRGHPGTGPRTLRLRSALRS
ncbi:hypothetical protein SALBM135S_03400 [Streptomyces alboniger]